MGNIFNQNLVFVQVGNEKPKKPVRVDERRRNSLAYYIARYLKFDGEDFNQLVLEVKRERESHVPRKKAGIRDKKNSLIAEMIALGSMQEVRFQVINNFRKINKNYREPWGGNSLMHIMCQEGYLSMIEFIFDESKHSKFDHVDINFFNHNDRDRIPFFLCFTPPTATAVALQNGMDENGNPVLIKPESIEIINDWTTPGSKKKRQQLIEFLIHKGQDVNVTDFHNYTALHFASMWGWIETISLLLEKGVDVNCATVDGKTPLFFAVEFGHYEAVLMFADHPNIHIDQANADGYTPLHLALEKSPSRLDMVKVLLERGADVNAETLRGKSALKIASSAQDVEAINMLLNFNVFERFRLIELIGKIEANSNPF